VYPRLTRGRSYELQFVTLYIFYILGDGITDVVESHVYLSTLIIYDFQTYASTPELIREPEHSLVFICNLSHLYDEVKFAFTQVACSSIAVL
jgi:hypothetical protein